MDQDARISRLTRALLRAETEETFVHICIQIQELLEINENRRYVMRSFNCLLVPLDATFKYLTTVKWPDGVHQYAKLLAKIANSIDVMSVKFFTWIFESMDKGTPDIRTGDMVAIVQDVFFKMIPLLSTKTCQVLIVDIHSIMIKEHFQSADTFKALCSGFIKVLGRGSVCKTQVFQEFVDIVVGWMVDEDQTENKTYLFCAEILLKLETYFAFDDDFTSHLLAQILEDFEEAIFEVQTNNELKKLIRTSLLIKAYTTIKSIPCQLEKSYEVDSSERFMANVNKILSVSHLQETNDLFVFKTKRKIIQHALDYLAQSTEHADGESARLFIKELLHQGLTNADMDTTTFPLLRDLSHGLCSWIQTISNHPNVDEECLEMVDMTLKFFDTDFNYVSDDDPMHLVGCIHSFLRSRSVLILQKVYNWLLHKCQFSHEEPRITCDKKIISTVLICLSDIACNKTNLILTRWALDPPIFDFLMIVFNCTNDVQIRRTILHLLKAHCLAHSHFVSSVFSQQFTTDSPGSSHLFLQTLMEFWLDLLKRESLSIAQWIISWIVVFVRSSSSYSALLSESYSQFYFDLFAIASDRVELYLDYAKLLYAIVTEDNYQNTIVYSIARDTCVNLLSHAKNLDKDTKLQIFKVFQVLNQVVIVEAGFEEEFLNFQNDDKSLAKDKVADTPSSQSAAFLCEECENTNILMSPAEFDKFIADLLVVDSGTAATKDSSNNDETAAAVESVAYSKKVIRDAVGILINGKLRSSLGKPPDLFSQLQNLFKKYRALKDGYKIPKWKLDFVFQLDREINLAMQESLLNRPMLTDAVKHFYSTNRVPCTEWLKRLRFDVSEVAIQSHNNELGFLYASSASDDVRIKRVSFGLKDTDTLSAMQEYALQLYLNGNFEESVKVLDKSSNGDDVEELSQQHQKHAQTSIAEITGKISDVLGALASKSLMDWSAVAATATANTEKDPQKDLKLLADRNPPVTIQNILPSSLLQGHGTTYMDVLCNSILESSPDIKKTSWLIIGNQDKIMNIHTVLKLAEWAKENTNVSPELYEQTVVLKMAKLIEKGNQNLVRSMLAEQKMTANSPSSLKLSVPCLTEFKLHCLKAQADLLFADGQIEKSAEIYGALSSLLDSCTEQSELEQFKSFKFDFILSFTSKLEKFPNFMKAILHVESDTNISLPEQNLILKNEFAKCLNKSDGEENQDCWCAYGNYVYNCGKSLNGNVEFYQDSQAPLKTQAVECYTQYLSLCRNKNVLNRNGSVRRKSPKVLTSMVRLVSLFREGYEMEPERVFVNNEWLTLLPSLSQIEKIQNQLFQRFPQQVAFHLASQQAIERDYYKVCIKDRKSLFEPDAYGFYEFTEDAAKRDGTASQRTTNTNNRFVKEQEKYHFPLDPSTGLLCTNNNNNLPLEYDETKYLNLPEEVKVIFRELQRVGTSREDQWIYAFQRMHVDWHKRISCLKDDLARDSSPEVFTSYTLPVIIYFEEMLKLAQVCETPGDLLFLMRHKSSIAKIISGLRSSQSIAELLEAYSELSRLVNSFSSTSEPKIFVNMISPVLAKFDFVNCSFPIALPGIPTNVFIAKVEPQAHILATKTRPKRLTFRGSDGRSYSYLVKGNENLNVDSGVMQFMNMIEHVVQWPTRSYYVTPLGKKGGLIQLVTNTTPLFHLYKKFLQKNGIDERTTDIFWARMNALGADRSNQIAVKQVFEQLLRETSPDILSKEMLLTARNPKAWYNAVSTLTSDCALGSAMGYVLGIGDRHLDNILVDLKAGYFIHVDFSLVFGKGATLRVPEKVPFRLTQNICAALKYPGQSGSFKVLLEKFVLAMKEYEDIILFGIQNVAESYSISEDLPIFPLPILKAELNSAVSILRSRQTNIKRPGAILKADLLDMCKELNFTKSDSAVMQEKLDVYTKDIENLTIALSILNEKKEEPVKLNELREKCDFISKRRDLLKNLFTLKQVIRQRISSIQEALSIRDELSIQTDKKWKLLHHIKVNMSLYPRKKSWYEAIALFQEAIELADITLSFSLILVRHPITCHPIARVLSALQETSEPNLTVKPLKGCHTAQTATSVATLLNQELLKTEDQIARLRLILTSQEITDVESEIKKIEALSNNTEETLSRYTLIDPHSEDTSDMDLFLKFALPVLERTLNEPTVSYDFIVKILLLCRNASKLNIPMDTYGVLESLINLHVKARDDLSLLLDSRFDTLLHDGYKVISSVAVVLKALMEDQEITNEDYTKQKLLERWGAAMMELKRNFDNFKKWLTGVDVNAFDVTAGSDIVTRLLSPITNFTLPLTQECQYGIVRSGRKLLALFSQYNLRNQVQPSADDPLVGLLEEQKALEARIRFLKDLHHSLDGCESAALFLATEKDWFEWAFQHHLRNLNSSRRWDGLNIMVELLQAYSAKWLQVEGNEYLNGSKSIQDSEYPNLLPEMYEYMSTVYKFVSAVVTFESNRFSKMYLKEYDEFKRQFASLAEKQEDMQVDTREITTPENFIVSNSEAMNARIQAHSPAGDKNWANVVEKFITCQLQTEMHKKKVLNENIAKSGQSDKLIVTRMSRIVNRWRRVLANLHPTLMFIHKYAKMTDAIKNYKSVIDRDWMPRVARFWLYQTEEKQLGNPSALHDAFDFSERTLRVLVDILEKARPIEVNDELVGQYSTVENKSENLVAYCKEKIETFNQTISVERLISDACRPETLAKMYEGWSAWV